jgi:GNAT superfamily N-acetyltransferase
VVEAPGIIRPLRPDDLADLMRLKAGAGWNQTEEDWLRILRLDASGCIGVECDGRVVASATSISYDRDLSWIGMVLTLGEHRGKGLARRLMEQSLSLCRSRASRAIRLDASDMGKPLYSSLGFLDECLIERWVRPPAPLAGPRLAPARVDLTYDREVFGADRSALLEELSRLDSAAMNRSYAFARPGSNYSFFGPCVSDNFSDARTLIKWFIGRYGQGPVCMDIFPHHGDVVRLAREFGFEPARRLTRMVLSPARATVPDVRVYAAAGFEFG